MADPSLWLCQVCEKPYPVPVLARDCEKKHEREEQE